MIILSKLKHFIFYYFLLLLGLGTILWLLWARFIRERLPRDIPDPLFNEYRFWIIFYICCIYLYLIKNLIKPKSNNFFADIVEIFFLPWKTLDHLLKYNKYFKPYYYNFMNSFITKLLRTSEKQKMIIIFFLQIFPRIILVSFLLLDIFYFQKLELLYKIVFLGIIPLIHRYIKYSLKDIIKHYINLLEEIYEEIFMTNDDNADPYVDVDVLLQDKNYCENLKLEQYLHIYTDIYLKKNLYTEYSFKIICKEEIYAFYREKKYGYVNARYLTKEDYNYLEKDFHPMFSKITPFNIFLREYQDIMEYKIIKWSRIIIFSCYFISWLYFLSKSYYYYPNDFQGFQHLIFNYARNLLRYMDPFNEHEKILTKNYFIINLIKYISKKILKKLFNEE